MVKFDQTVELPVIKSTIFYYCRLFVYVGFLILLLQLMQLVPQATVAALKSIILFVVFLIILIAIKSSDPVAYVNLERFCQPGITFLKSWTSLFFFAYLVQLPVGLSGVAGEQIVSWLFQVCLGNILALGVCVFSIGTFLKYYDNQQPMEDSHNSASIQSFEVIADEENMELGNIGNESGPASEIKEAAQEADQCHPSINADVTEKTLEVAESVSEGINDPDLSPAVTPDASPLSAAPFVPDADTIFRAWLGIFLATSIINTLMVAKTQSTVIAFQLSGSVLVYMLATTYRLRFLGRTPALVQSFLQPPILFAPVVIVLVMLSGKHGMAQWKATLQEYLVSNFSILTIDQFGAGNYLALFLNPAIVSLSFAAVEPLIKYHRVIFCMTPMLFVVCAVIYLLAAFVSFVLQSPPDIAYPLLAHSITTPIALGVSEITGGDAGLTAATAVLNGVLGLRLDIKLLDWWGVTNPINRGISNGTAGTLLGIIALMELGEDDAIGVGMAGYSITTIIFAILVAIPPFEALLVSIV